MKFGRSNIEKVVFIRNSRFKCNILSKYKEWFIDTKDSDTYKYVSCKNSKFIRKYLKTPNCHFVIDGLIPNLKQFVEHFKKQGGGGTNYYVYVLDAFKVFESNPNSRVTWKNNYDFILTLDKKQIITFNLCDAEKYGWHYASYSFKSWKQKKPKKMFDVNVVQTFHWKDETRERYSKNLLDFLEKNGCSYYIKNSYSYKKSYKINFKKSNGKNEWNLNDRKIERNLSKINGTVLNLEYSNYVTVKNFLPVQHNKKMITNADSIKLEPWYNPKWARVVDYDNLTQEDIDFIKDDTIKPNYSKADRYCYSGDAWSKKILKIIKENN